MALCFCMFVLIIKKHPKVNSWCVQFHYFPPPHLHTHIFAFVYFSLENNLQNLKLENSPYFKEMTALEPTFSHFPFVEFVAGKFDLDCLLVLSLAFNTPEETNITNFLLK